MADPKDENHTAGVRNMVGDKLYQKITDICFENGGVSKPMVDKLYALLSERERVARIDVKKEIIEALQKSANYCGKNMAVAKDELAKATFTSPQMEDNVRKWSYPLAEFNKIIKKLSQELAQLQGGDNE